jgi:hypothetical protein
VNDAASVEPLVGGPIERERVGAVLGGSGPAERDLESVGEGALKLGGDLSPALRPCVKIELEIVDREKRRFKPLSEPQLTS